MRKLIALLVVLAFSRSAFAADLPLPTKAPPIPPAPTWTGWYVGGNVGAAWGKFTNSYTAPGNPNPPNFIPTDAAAISANGSNVITPAGFIGGFQAGYNYQIQKVVLGIEADIDFLGLGKSASSSVVAPVAGPTTSTTSINAPWLFTLRPRVGIAVGQALIYATGGLAVAEVNLSETNTFSPLFSAAGTDALSTSQARAGWTVGGGAQYRINKRWSIKAEYLYVDLGTLNASSSGPSPYFGNPAIINYSHSLNVTEQIVRVGANFKLY